MDRRDFIRSSVLGGSAFALPGAFAKPRPGKSASESLFVPPSLFHLIAKGHLKGGLLDLDYLAHGLHYSLVSRET